MAQVHNSQLDAFDLYHKIQEAPEKTVSLLGGPALPALGHAIAGSTGAAISNLCTYPLALIITRQQIQRQLRKDASSTHSAEYTSIRDAAYKIYAKEGGLNGFYVGVLSDTSKTIADSFLFFLAYNFLRQSRLRSAKASRKHLPVLDELSVGFLAGAFAKLFTTPIANIVTRKQTSSMLSGQAPGNTTDQGSIRSIALQIRKEKGWQGFWSGYSASLVLTLNPSLTFFFFETLKRNVLPRSQRASPSAQATFLLAALSKALASTITYPFSLAKSRLQASVPRKHDSKGVERTLEESARRPSNAFSTILHIARTQGISALYEGLDGEVLKGFFSHGITMIVKEAVHKLVIRLYYTILKLLRKYPSPKELVASAKQQADGLVDHLDEKTQHVAVTAKSGMETIVEAGQGLISEANARLSKDPPA